MVKGMTVDNLPTPKPPEVKELKQAEEKLRESEEKFSKAFRSSGSAICITSLKDNKFIEINESFTRFTGYPREEVIGHSAAELGLWVKKEELGQWLNKLQEKGEAYNEEFHSRMKSGEIRVGLASAETINIRGERCRITVIADITERNQMEELFKTVTNSSPVGIYITQNGKFQLVNPRFQKLTGYTEEELLGMDPLNLVLPKDRETVRKKAVKMLKGERSSPYQFRVVNKDGETRWVMETVTSIQFRGRRATLGNYMDITERRQTDEKVQQQNEFLNNILDALTHPFYVLDANDYTIKMGNLATKAGNLSENPTCYALTHQIDQPCRGANHTCPLEEVKKTKEPVVVEHIHYDADGNTRNIEVHGYPIFDEKGNVAQMIEYSLDITERKRTEEALRESEEFRSSLLTNSPNPIDVINPDSSLRYVNPALEKLTGFTAAELIGKKAPYPYWTQETLKKTTTGFRKAMRQGDQRTEELFQKKNGERFWVKITSMPVVNNGEFKYLLTNWVDITKRKQAEEALRQSEKKYKNLAEATSDMIWEINEKGIFTFVSPRIKDILGYEASEVTGKMRTLDLTTKAEAQKWLKRFKEINAKQEPFFGFEIAHLHKNGTPVLFETSGIPTFDNAGNFKGYVGVNKDITDRKQAEQQLQGKNEQLDAQNEELRSINEELQATEEELQRSRESLERMFASVTDSISVINLSGIITKVNQRTVEIHGFASEDEILGINAFDLVAPRDHKRIETDMSRALKEGLIIGGEYTLLKADGSEFPGELSTSVLKDSQGKAMGHITIARDITERKQAEERERQLEQELNLAGRLASIGQLAAGVAHEINNPLTGVIGFSHLMMNRNIPNDMKQDLQVINSEAQRVAKIVENLLVFAHQRKTGREYAAINDIITQVLELRSYEMRVNNIDVETQLDPNLPLTMADTGQLQQVFLNIVLNAEYSMTKAHHKGKLLVKTEKINGNIRASFTDNGAGISRENLDKIFNPFFTTKEVGKGTGLGLSICHGIITQHKGRIYAQSEPGKGAVFVIELPIVAEPAQAGKAKVTQKEAQKPRGAKILVVDDEAAILTFLHRLLTEWGHTVETINNADTALKRLKTERYSLILLDIKLPGMSGIELYRHIEEIAPALTRRVMFITGDIMEGTTRDFLEKAGVPHITKPLDIEVLKKMINNILTGGAQRLTA
jgi:PAS domain S-box-containing protein